MPKIVRDHTEKHLQHQVDVVLTPDLKHYSKLVCRDCSGLFLQWLTRTDTEQLTGVPQAKKKIRKAKKSWTTTGSKERQHWKSYQPKPQLKNTQLIGDRLALRGHYRYNGNTLGSIPLKTLQQILTTRIDNSSDRQYIEKHIEMRSGPEPGPSHSV